MLNTARAQTKQIKAANCTYDEFNETDIRSRGPSWSGILHHAAAVSSRAGGSGSSRQFVYRVARSSEATPFSPAARVL